MRVIILFIVGLALVACSPDAGESKKESVVPQKTEVKDTGQLNSDTLSIQDTSSMTDISDTNLVTTTGLMYQVLREGADEKIGEGGVLKFHYELKDKNGTVIKSSLKNVHPYGMKLGLELVPKILDKSLVEFNYGQKIALKIPSQHPEMEKFPELAHTEKDTLIYEIDIMPQPKTLEREGVKVSWLYESGAVKVDSGDVIGIDYFAFDEAGNIFNTSRDNGVPYEFTVGKAQIVKGLDMIFASLRQGDKVVVEIPAKHAFGSKGLLDKVGPNEDVTYMLTIDYKK